MKKTIFLFNDGTGQHLESDAPTNVAKLFWCLPGRTQKKPLADDYKVDSNTGNVAIYIRGIGTIDTQYVQEPKKQSLWDKISTWFSGKSRELEEQITGTTIVDRVKRSYDLFVSNYNPGDDVVLIGFSRGAASIRLLASELIKRHNVVIKYMLVFDTVYSVMGDIRILDNPPMNRFTNLDISSNILRCDHLIAGDEMREKFPFSPVNRRDGVRQILFAGSHSDVGGGHQATGLSDISLQFALEQLRHLGFSTDPQSVAQLNLNPNFSAETNYVIIGGIGQKHFPRVLHDGNFVVHRSVIERSKIKGMTSIALAQLSQFSTNSNDELINPKDVVMNFDF